MFLSVMGWSLYLLEMFLKWRGKSRKEEQSKLDQLKTKTREREERKEDKSERRRSLLSEDVVSSYT